MAEPALKTDARYREDFAAWAEGQVALLRAGKLQELDTEHLIEEIGGLVSSQRKEIVSRSIVLLMHMLKHDHQPARRSRSWRSTMRTQRQEIQLVLEQSPSLRRDLREAIRRAYPDARSARGGRDRVAAPDISGRTAVRAGRSIP